MITNFEQYAIESECKTGEVCVSFKVYTFVQCTDGSLLYLDDTHEAPEYVEDMTKASLYLHGQVKWDGCSDWHFDEQDRGMLHSGTRDSLIDIGKLLAKCWDIAKEELGEKWQA